MPSRLVLLECPSQAAFESVYHGPVYGGLKGIRDEVSSGRLVGVVGVGPDF